MHQMHDKEVEGIAMPSRPVDMSNPMATAAPGSKKWFWQMRIWHFMLFALPLFPLLYGWMEAKWSDPVIVQVMTWGPWVASAVALVFVSRALWRIEINVAGNRQHPFTKRDAEVLQRAASATVGALFFAVLVPVLLVGSWGIEVTQAQKNHLFGAIDATAVSMTIVSVLLASILRIHKKARVAYEELEKGV